LVAVVAAVVAAVAYIESGSEEPSASPASTTIPRLSDLVGETPDSNDVATDFEVPTLDGGNFSLAVHQAEDGRPVFLNLWASWCFPCREEMPEIDAAARAHPEVLFIGVAVADDNEAAAEFAREINVEYTIAFDRDDQVADGYPVLGMPGTFLISADGIVIRTVFGGVDEDGIEELLGESFGI
jgi:thiol-disulfide isomerase/thioredoxin